ncbi:hypothetical protein M0802_016306 [Mischocyttarus mexicanus]|nr:hypothetical protein M0802_016306 [Mischocyttarus mexicanus]
MRSKSIEKTRGGGSHSTAVQAGALAGPSSSSSYDCHVLQVGNLASGLEAATGRRKNKDIRLEDILMEPSCEDATPIRERAVGSSRVVDGVDVSPALSEITVGIKRKNPMRLTSSSEEEREMGGRIDSEEEASEYMEMTRLLDRVIGHFELIEEARKTCGNLKGEVSGKMKKNTAKGKNALQLLRRKILKTGEGKEESREIQEMRQELHKMENRNRWLEESNKTQASEIRRLKKAAVEGTPAKIRAAPVRVVDAPQATGSALEVTGKLEERITLLIQRLSEEVGEIRAHLGMDRREETLSVAAKKVRVAGDVQPTAGTPNSFVEVVKRGRKEKRVEEITSGKTTGLGRELAGRKENAGSLPVVRTPKKANKGPREEAVVSVTVTEEGGSYKDALLRAREVVNIKDMGVEGMRCRRGATGAYLFEIKGPGSRQKARSIAEALKNKVTGVKVGVPVRTGTFKVCGLDPGTTAREIRED